MNILTTLEQWIDWSKEYRTLPFLYPFPLEEGYVQNWTAMWTNSFQPSFLLESGKESRYSYLSNKPRSMIQGKNQYAHIYDFHSEHATKKLRDKIEISPLQAVKSWMSAYSSPRIEGFSTFLGGCVGFWSYDVVRSFEKIPQLAKDDLLIPDYCFVCYDELWIIDHQEQMGYVSLHVHIDADAQQNREKLSVLFEQTCDKAEKMKIEFQKKIYFLNEQDWNSMKNQTLLLPIDEAIPKFELAFLQEEYIQAVQQIQEYIRQGDVFQVNLSVRQCQKMISPPEQIYEALRQINPSPYMGLLRFGDYALVCGSPELLVKCIDGKLTTRPIAGTRPRGANENEDYHLAMELRNNEKERAEHVMLVDLERNDLGRISKFGTVRVDEFMTIEPYSHVMHLVSEVTGELADGKDAYDIIRAVFPGGTITGAPKVRTMEIIEELEPVRRGPYTGSLGWIDYNGNMEFNIIIRSLLCANGIGYVQAGAGIVIDSVPEKEYIESINKAKAIWNAIASCKMETIRSS